MTMLTYAALVASLTLPADAGAHAPRDPAPVAMIAQARAGG